MKRQAKKNTAIRARWRWFSKGATVITVSLCLFVYLALTQLYSVLHSGLYEGEALWWAYAGNLAKCIVIVLAAALFWYFLAIQDYHATFSGLMDIFSDEGPTGEEEDGPSPYSKNQELDQLLESASNVIRTNKIYRTQLDTQKGLLLENYIMRLMKGRVQDISATYESAEAFGVNLRAKGLQVLVFCPDEETRGVQSEKAVDIMHQMLRTLIDNMLFRMFTGYVTEVDGMVACLLVSDSNDKLGSENFTTELKRIATLIQLDILEKAGQVVRVAISRANTGIAGIEKSFSEAVELLQYAEITDSDEGVLVYREIPQIHMSDRDDQFWFKKEMQFMNCINAEDYQSAATLFSEILDNEYLLGGLPLKLANCRMMGLINSMVNALGKVRVTMDADFFEQLDPWNRILNCKSLPELQRCSNEIFNSIHEYTESQKKQSSYDRMGAIIIYLKKNYSDPNLCASSVADEFGLNPSYLSRIFKKLVGMGLAEYLQRVRIDAAMELMKDEGLSVKEAAEQVGYSSVLTMNRAFKKYEGTTAGKLRNVE